MNRLSDIITDLAGIAGAGLITFGVSMVYAPAAYIVAGAFLLAGAWLNGRKAAD